MTEMILIIIIPVCIIGFVGGFMAGRETYKN